MENLILSHLLIEAQNAHRHTSFSPEKRGQQIVVEYSQALTEDLDNLPAEYHEEYKEKYISKLRSWLSAKSRCASTMITGGSNFNVRRNEKANQSEHNRYNEFYDFRTNFFDRVKKRQERAKSPEQKRIDFFETYKSDFISSATTIRQIDAGINRYTSRPLIVANMVNKVKTIVRKGDFELSQMTLELLKKLSSDPNFKKPLFTAKNSVWKLLEATEAQRESIADRESQENETLFFDGGQVVINYKEDRLQITHDSIPSKEVRTQLKSNGFKWSPFNVCWQRKLNSTAKHFASIITGVQFV